MMPPTALHEDPTFVLLRRDNLMVAAWHDAPSLAQMRIIGRHMDVWRPPYDHHVAYVNVIVNGRVEGFNAEVREAAKRLSEKYPPALCVANIVLVQGLSGILTRTVMRAMRMVGRTHSPWRVFDSCGEAATWIAQQLDGQVNLTWSASEVLAVLNQAARR